MRIENGKRKVENGGVQDTFHFPLSIFKSNVVLRCVAYGGIYGGTLTIARNGAFQRKLSQVGGSLLPGSAQVPPETVLTFEAEYEPVAPSDAANDIVATASLVEDFLNETHTNSSSFTSIRVELRTNRIAISNRCRQRHCYGVGEDVELSHFPVALRGEWEVKINDQFALDSPLYNTGEGFMCCMTSGVGQATFIVDGGLEKLANSNGLGIWFKCSWALQELSNIPDFQSGCRRHVYN